ncbi:MAG TPA: hypothetical protein VJ873_05575, partial [bacterium]|nr:hypothetical protein [bacterium]
DEVGLALYHWDKYLEIVPKDADARQHMIDMRKPLLTKKQAQELEKLKQQENGGAKATPVSTPNAPLTAPVILTQENNSSPTGTAPATVPSLNDQTAASAPTTLAVPPAGAFPTPTPSTQLVPVEVAQPSPTAEIVTIPH